MKRGILIGIIIAIILITIIIFTTLPDSNSENLNIENQNPQNENTEEEINNEEEAIQEEDEIEIPTNEIKEVTIEMSSSGFSPNSIEIEVGTKVNFLNVGTRNIWPASDHHPTHTVYPDSGITKCGTSEEENIFDSCKGISPGETYSFVFNEIGTWDYHDHLRSSLSGTIIVK